MGDQRAKTGWRPPPGAVGKYAQIQGTGLARDVLDGWAPVRVAHSAGALFDRMDTGRLGLSRRSDLGRVAVGNVAGFDLTRGATRSSCARLSGPVATSGRPGRPGAIGWWSAS